ncbi:hypothetical protein NB705_003506 [Xanthomonas sacchari]|nr:hypothetical protein [Xanthomonas sacchari]
MRQVGVVAEQHQRARVRWRQRCHRRRLPGRRLQRRQQVREQVGATGTRRRQRTLAVGEGGVVQADQPLQRRGIGTPPGQLRQRQALGILQHQVLGQAAGGLQDLGRLHRILQPLRIVQARRLLRSAGRPRAAGQHPLQRAQPRARSRVQVQRRRGRIVILVLVLAEMEQRVVLRRRQRQVVRLAPRQQSLGEGGRAIVVARRTVGDHHRAGPGAIRRQRRRGQPALPVARTQRLHAGGAVRRELAGCHRPLRPGLRGVPGQVFWRLRRCTYAVAHHHDRQAYLRRVRCRGRLGRCDRRTGGAGDAQQRSHAPCAAHASESESGHGRPQNFSDRSRNTPRPARPKYSGWLSEERVPA